jgi:hypothetical protein
VWFKTLVKLGFHKAKVTWAICFFCAGYATDHIWSCHRGKRSGNTYAMIFSFNIRATTFSKLTDLAIYWNGQSLNNTLFQLEMNNTLFQPKTIGRMVNWFLAVHDGSCASWHSIAVQMDQIHNILFSVTNWPLKWWSEGSHTLINRPNIT